MALLLCTDCHRHFRPAENLCPFCGTKKSGQLPQLTAPLGASRSQRYVAKTAWLAAAATLTACSTSPDTTQSVSQGNGANGTATGINPTATLGATSLSSTSLASAATSLLGSGNPTHSATSSAAPRPSATGTLGAVPSSSVVTVPSNAPPTSGHACPGHKERPAGSITCQITKDCDGKSIPSSFPGALANGSAVCALGPIQTTYPRDPCHLGPQLPPPDPSTCKGTIVANVGGCGMICQPDCDATTCTTPNHCVNNVCQAPRCNEPNGPVCSTGYACKPESSVASTSGCQLLRCDEPMASTCPTGSVCKPTEATDALGCRPIKCDEAGGASCTTGSVCLPGSRYASADGCAPTPCTATQGCSPWLDCHADELSKPPTTAGISVDTSGCGARACSGDGDCACGYCVNGTCAPEQGICVVPVILATPYGCVWPDDEFV